jgi:hypothetical protein
MVGLDDPNMLKDNLLKWYLINEVQERSLETTIFKTLGDLDRLVKFSLGLVQVLRKKMVEAKVILKDARSRMCEFNPPYLLLEGHTLWVLEGGKF